MSADPDTRARWARDLAADEYATVRAITAELRGADDPEARALLAGALAGRTGPLAADALAGHGALAVPLALAALDDPPRRAAAAVTLAKIGAPEAVPALRQLTRDPSPLVRTAVAIGLWRCGLRDGELISEWAPREGDVTVLGYLAAVGGNLAVDLRARSNFDAQALDESTPVEIRAGCAWAVAAHDPARGAELAAAVTASPGGTAALAAVVARRGGPLAARYRGGDAAADRIGEQLGLTPAA